MAHEERIAELAKWVELRARQSTYLELRATTADSSMIDSWDLNADPGTLAAVVESVCDVVTSEAGDGALRAFYLFAFRKRGEAKHESRYIIRWGGLAKPLADDGGRGVIRELLQNNKDLHSATLEAHRVVREVTTTITDASTRQLAECTKQLAEYQKDSWRIYELLREVSRDERGAKREELEGKKDLERTRVGGELLTMLAPAVLAKMRPGDVAASGPTGDYAVVALLRTITDDQRSLLVDRQILRLSTPQMTAALGLFGEIKGAKNGEIASPLLRELAKWIASLTDDQMGALSMGEVQLREEQAAGFLEIYVHAAEHSEQRAATS